MKAGLGDKAISRLLFDVFGSLKLIRFRGAAFFTYCILRVTDNWQSGRLMSDHLRANNSALLMPVKRLV
jgi:hypothetical protein